MTTITLDQQKLDEMKGKLNAARSALKDDGVVMRQIAVFLDQWVQKNFQSSGGKVGGWVPFTYGGRLTTLDPKAKSNHGRANAKSISGHRWINGSAKLLMDTGLLRHSFLPFIRKGLAGIGSELPYAKAHDEGVQGKVPQRRILMKQSEILDDVNVILENWVLVTLKGIAK